MTIRLQLGELGPCLGSRGIGRQLREQIEEAGSAQLDFTDVEVLSASFADELFAVLVRDYGTHWFKRNIEFINAPESVIQDVLNAVAERMPELA